MDIYITRNGHDIDVHHITDEICDDLFGYGTTVKSIYVIIVDVIPFDIVTLAHELYHVFQREHDLPYDENDADEFAEFYG